VVFNFFAYLAFRWLDWSVTDTSESPNWSQQDIKRKKAVAVIDVPITDDKTATPATIVTVNPSKPPAVYISFNNLSYIVDIPKRKAKKPVATTSVPNPTAATTVVQIEGKHDDAKHQNGAIEMGEIKQSDSNEALSSENTVEQLVDDAPGKRTLLKDVYGYAKPGMMVALMGGSGAGKTTLLDVLAGKKTGGDIINDALVNGKLRDKSFSRIAGYVEQFDSHDELSTIREAIEFSAMLRLSSNISYEDKISRVNEVIQTLRLSHVQHQRIGGVSPEIRKKVTIAVELVMNPGLLFLDEPTTGLDSAGALAVMHAVRSLSKSITVICTIHQPSIEIVNCFSHVLLMNKWEQRGRVAYFGSVKDMPSWFGTNGLGSFHEGTNIAEFGLESLQVAGKNKVNVASIFLQSNEGKQVLADLTSGIAPVSNADAVIEYSTYATGFINQVIQNTKRFVNDNARNQGLLLSRYGVTAIGSIIAGLLWYHLDLNQKGAANRISIMFVGASFPVFSCMAPLPNLITSRPVYFREKNSQMYSPLAYYIGRVLGDQPYVIMEGLLFSCIIYWMAGLRSDDNGSHFGMFIWSWYLIRAVGTGYIETIVGLSPTAEAAAKVASAGFSFGQIFAGFLIRRTAIPAGWIWMHYLSIWKYSISFYAMNELSGLTFSCPDHLDAVSLALKNTTDFTSLVANSNGVVTCDGIDGGLPCYACPIVSGDSMLNVFDFNVS
jgi:ABC-type multidrug transport system ATPase subunit